MSVFLKVSRDIIYQTVGRVIGTILGLVTIGIMTRYLGQAGFGYFTTIVSFMQFFGVLADFGLQMTTSTLISRPDADEEKIFNNIFTLRFFSALIFLGFTVIISFFLPYPTVIKQGIALVSFSFLFISLQSIFVSALQKNLAASKIALAEILNRSVLLIGVILAFIFNFNLLFIILTVVVANFLNFLILFLSTKKFYRLRFDFDWPIWKNIWSATWPIALSVAITLIYFRADTLIMSFSRSQNEVGLYGAAYRVLETMIQFPYLIMGSILPLLARHFISDKKALAFTFQRTFDFLLAFTLPLALATFILGEKIMVFLAGKDFLVSGQILRLLIIATVAIYFKALFGYTIAAANLQKKMIKFYLLDSGITLALYLVFIPFYGFWAAAILTVFSEIFILLAAGILVRKNLNLKPRLTLLKEVLIACFIMTGFIFLFYQQHLLIIVFIGFFIYCFSLILLLGKSWKKIIPHLTRYD